MEHQQLRLHVTHCESDGKIIRICGQIEKQIILAIETAIQLITPHLNSGINKPLYEHIKPSLICLAKYNHDQQYYRARIETIIDDNTNNVVVYFLDYGNSEIVSIDSIRILDQLDPILRSVPPQATRFLLTRSLINNNIRGQDAANVASELIKYYEVICTVEKRVKSAAFVSVNMDGKDLSDYLAERGLVDKVSIEDQERAIFQPTPSQALVPPPPIKRSIRSVAESPGRSAQQRITWQNRSPATETSWRRQESIPEPTARLVPAVEPPLPPPPATYKSRLLELNSHHEVKVSFAGDGPELFAIRLTDDERGLCALQAELARAGCVPLAEPPVLGSVCLGRFPGDGSLCRAVVIGLPGDRCKLFFVDFGITESVHYYDVFAIDPRFVRPSVYALRFCLSGIKELKATERLKATFKRLVEGQVLKLRVVPPEGPPLIQYCQLYLGNQNVRDLLGEDVSEENGRVEYSEISAEKFIENTPVTVTSVDSCARFFVQLAKNKSIVEEMMAEVQSHCGGVEPPQFSEVTSGMPCCALFPDDGLWYRATVVNIRRDKITVYYVDYGNDCEVTVDSLRPMTPTLLKTEAQAVCCSLRGFEDRPNDDAASEAFESITVEKILTVKNVKKLPKRTLLLTLLNESSMDVASNVLELSLKKPNESQWVQENSPATFQQQSGNGRGNFNSNSKPYGKKDFNSDEFKTERKPYEKKNFNSDDFKTERRPYERKNFNSDDSKAEGRSYQKRDGNSNDYQRKRNDSNDNNECLSSKKVKDVSKRNSFTPNNNVSQKKKPSDMKRHSNSVNINTSNRDNKPKRQFDNNRYDNKKDFNSYNNRQTSKPKFFSPQKYLDNPVPPSTRYEQCVLEMGKTYDVKICWFINPNNFYIQLASEYEKLQSMMNDIPNIYKGVKPYEGSVDVGDNLMAKFSQDSVLYRAQVIAIKGFQKYVVQYVDFGNKSLEGQNNLWQLDSKLLDFPQFSIHCSLTGVSPITDWSSDVDQYFSEEKYTCKLVSTSENICFVSLSKGDEDLSAKLIENNIAKAVNDADININVDPKPKSVLSTKQENKIVKIKPVEKVSITISHIDSPGQFWIKLTEHSENWITFHKEIQELETEPLINREEGTLCIAKYSGDDQYYRATILDTDSEITTIRLLDSGLTDVLNNDPKLLKMISAKHSEVPPFAFKCSVNAIPTGVGQWNEQATDLFKNLTSKPEDSLSAVFIHKGETNYVDLYVGDVNTTENLINAEYAVKVEETESGDLPICYASHINSPSEFWIQLENSSGDLETIDEKLKDAENFPPLTEIEEEVICAAKFPEDGFWYRAQIIVNSGDGTEVLFMDYGNSSLTDELRSLPDELKSAPALSKRCALQKPTTIKNWSKEAELKFSELAAEGATTFHVSFIASGDISIVELLMDGKSVTEELISLSQVHLENVSDIDYDETKIDSTKPQPCYISYCNSPVDFWIQYQSASQQLNLIVDGLVEAEKFDDLTDIVEDTLCVTQFPEDDAWYRSKVIDHGANGTEILHVDYGSKSIVTKLKKLPEELAKIPLLAKHCSLVNHEIFEGEILHEKFLELATSEETNIQVLFVNMEADPKLVKILIGDEDIVDNFKLSLNIPIENNVDVPGDNNENLLEDVEKSNDADESEIISSTTEIIETISKITINEPQNGTAVNDLEMVKDPKIVEEEKIAISDDQSQEPEQCTPTEFEDIEPKPISDGKIELEENVSFDMESNVIKSETDITNTESDIDVIKLDDSESKKIEKESNDKMKDSNNTEIATDESNSDVMPENPTNLKAENEIEDKIKDTNNIEITTEESHNDVKPEDSINVKSDIKMDSVKLENGKNDTKEPDSVVMEP